MEEKKLRIFWNSNAPWSTSGYGSQMLELLPLIRDEGYKQGMCSFYGFDGSKLEIDGVLQYGKLGHSYGSDAIVHHSRDFKADVTFTLQDQWVLNPQDLQQVQRLIPITPIDHDPAPKIVLDKLRYAYRVVTYSKYGQKELQRNGIYSTYIPHTVNTEIFKPMDKKERRRQSNLPEDIFLCGMVAANKENPPRKSFQEVMDAFKMFLQKVPKAYLYIHTNYHSPGGFPLDEYAQFIGIKDRVIFPDTYQMNFNTGKAEMAKIYNCFDVFLMPSISEGFGIGIIESQACGVPAIVNDFTSMPELVKDGVTGKICKVAYKRFSPQLSYMGVPDVHSIYNCLLDIYKADRVKMGEEARKFMVEEYDTRKVFDTSWKPFLNRLQLEIYGKTT